MRLAKRPPERKIVREAGLAGDEAEERDAAVKRPPERRIVREAGGLAGDEAEGRDAAGEAAAGAEDYHATT